MNVTADTFWDHVEIREPKECWPWTRGKSEGYGVAKFYKPGRSSRKWVRAHRLAFFLTYGRWPEPCCLHTCDNPPCCNPAHLFEGTRGDNSRDMFRKKRNRNGCEKLTPNDVRNIRKEYAFGGVTQRALAEKYRVAVSQVNAAINHKQWRSVK